jgi:hypothetical protein
MPSISDAAPTSVRAPLKSHPSMRAPQPSYSDGPPPSVRVGQLPSLAPPASRRSYSDLAVESGSAIVPGSHSSMTPPASSESDDVARSVANFLKGLLAITDPEKFATIAGGLEPKIRALVAEGHVGPAWKLCSALSMIATEPPGIASRAQAARAAVAIFDDREILMQIAVLGLDPSKDRDGLARKLLVRAGDRGAHAAYQARTKHSVFEARERFVALVLEIGAAALPTVKKALLMLETRLSVAGALWLAEDVLKSVPDTRDEELGQCVARYAKMPTPSLALLATQALPRTSGAKSRPLLVAQLHHKEDDVAIAAIKCLRKLGIDAEIVAQLKPIVTGTARARPPVRLAATEALLDATPDALPLARTIAGETIGTLDGITPDVEDMLVMLSSVIIRIGGDGTLVAERWKKSTGFLRQRLEVLLRQLKV